MWGAMGLPTHFPTGATQTDMAKSGNFVLFRRDALLARKIERRQPLTFWAAPGWARLESRLCGASFATLVAWDSQLCQAVGRRPKPWQCGGARIAVSHTAVFTASPLTNHTKKGHNSMGS